MDNEGVYARASAKFKDKMFMLKGQWFYKKDALDVCGVDGRPHHQEYRDAIGQVLYNLTQLKDPVLEQRNKQYRIIRKDFKAVRPGDFTNKEIDFSWPVGIDDHTTFGFEDSITIQRGDVIGLGGEGNKGKSLFSLAVVTGNMDRIPTTLVLSENVHRLEERLSHFDWLDIHDKNGNWKFEVLAHRGQDEFLDIARERKDNLIVFDWLNVTKDSYRVADFYETLSERMNDGLALVIQQKRSYKEWAVGGEAALDYCSAFFLLKSGIITVAKVKVPKAFDPTDKMYRFKIVGSGSRFHDIAEVKTCGKCKGKKWVSGDICGDCNGEGYKVVDVSYDDEGELINEPLPF